MSASSNTKWFKSNGLQNLLTELFCGTEKVPFEQILPSYIFFQKLEIGILGLNSHWEMKSALSLSWAPFKGVVP